MLPPSDPSAVLGAPWTLKFPPATAPSSATLTWQRLKRAFDIAAAASMLLLSAPVLLLSLAAVRLTSRGPAVYTQRRVGLRGEVFVIFKVRTMRQDAEAGDGPRWCVPGDSRVTLMGKLLRATHLDELPQLWNVLRGEMSLVGPRPERPEFMPKLKSYVAGYDARHAVLPGITGLAQVQVGPDTDVANVARKLRYDLHYIRNRTAWLEAKILFCTGLKMFGVPLAALRSVMGLNFEDVPVEAPRLRRAA